MPPRRARLPDVKSAVDSPRCQADCRSVAMTFFFFATPSGCFSALRRDAANTAKGARCTHDSGDMRLAAATLCRARWRAPRSRRCVLFLPSRAARRCSACDAAAIRRHAATFRQSRAGCTPQSRRRASQRCQRDSDGTGRALFKHVA